MQIVLLNHVKGLGLKGEIKNVSEGYFRNFLAPRRLATLATTGAVSHVKQQEAKAIEKLESMKESAESIKLKLDSKTIQIKEKTTDAGTLYASVSKKEVIAAIHSQLNVSIPEKVIDMDYHIKQPGVYSVSIKLYKGITASLNLEVIAE